MIHLIATLTYEYSCNNFSNTRSVVVIPKDSNGKEDAQRCERSQGCGKEWARALDYSAQKFWAYSLHIHMQIQAQHEILEGAEAELGLAVVQLVNFVTYVDFECAIVKNAEIAPVSWAKSA